MKAPSSVSLRLAIGLIVAAALAFVDNFAFGGEVSPIVIVGMLFLFAAVSGLIWRARAPLPVAFAWICLPLAHVLKHMLHLPDTLHPNTYASILKLGAFTFVVTAIGLGFGIASRRLFAGHPTET
jgi:hypothetical protein